MSISLSLKKLQHRIAAARRLAQGAVSPFALQSKSGTLSCVPFFIISSGRSGSTLLRAIICQHTDVCIPPESHVIGKVAANFKKYYRYLPWEYVVRLVISEFQIQYPGFTFWKIHLCEFYHAALNIPPQERCLAKLIDDFYCYYRRKQKPDATRWGDKSLRNATQLPWISKLFPNAQYIHIIRDGRDVALSLVAADAVGVNDLGVAAEHWKKSVQSARRFGQMLDKSRYLEIRYEKLAMNPEGEIRRVYEFLGYDYSSDALQFNKNIKQLGDTSRPLHSNLQKPVNTESIGRWRKQLNEQEKELLNRRLKALLVEINYSLD